MPLPLLLAVPALLGAAGAGVKKGSDGFGKYREAKRVDAHARERAEHAERRLESAQARCDAALTELGERRAAIFDDAMPVFIAVLQRLRNAEVAAEAFDDAFKANDVSTGVLHEIALNQVALLGAAAAATVGGGAAAIGTTTAVGTFAAASTGTAIASLHGVAATNATLAWLGGGPLAAGGFGMAGGAMVVVGTFTAPAVLVAGVLLDAQMAKTLERARTNAAEVTSFERKIKAAVLRLGAVARAAQAALPVFDRLTEELRRRTDELAGLADGEPDVKAWTAEQRLSLKAAANLAGILVALGATPLIAEDGGLDPRFRKAMKRADG